MCKRKKKNEVPVQEPTIEETLDTFQLKKPEAVYDEDGNRDYFTEYYHAYKNNYIDQYLEAYRKFKNDGSIPAYSPVDVQPNPRPIATVSTDSVAPCKEEETPVLDNDVEIKKESTEIKK